MVFLIPLYLQAKTPPLVTSNQVRRPRLHETGAMHFDQIEELSVYEVTESGEYEIWQPR